MAHRSYHGGVRDCPIGTLSDNQHLIFSSIHERSAREKISTDQVAHVLNDEVSRKYIQSLKRFVSFLRISLHSPYFHSRSFELPTDPYPQALDIFSDQVPARRRFA